ncbi:MAG TPA: PQQ-like beta-propeller repeat protein [Candidatus Hydrogenedentes bacterium]|jgi:outer membrane protein assembly factor BamB|nr:PQQ-like beta-propeller repeat protein [Candidatus Hydrogenedentota bacterium]
MRKMLLLILAGIFLGNVALAGDSPQFRGPHRDGRFDEEGLLKTWPEDGPPLLWVAHGLGKGYSSPSVADGKIYVPGMADETTAAIFVLSTEGVIERTILVGPETEDKQAPGPRSTPTIEGDSLYMISGLGEVYCLDIASGTKRWSVNILERFGGPNIMYTLAESLLVDGDRVICTPGGPDAGLAALNKHTGETIWTTHGFSDPASYCSPIIYPHNGRRLLLTETANFLVGVDADSGQFLWQVEHLTRDGIHAVTPLYLNGLVYYTGGYKSGGGAVRLSDDGSAVEPVWKDETLDCQHHGVVLDQGYLYGTSHMFGNELICTEMATGKVMWTTKEVRQGVVIYADGMLYIYEGPARGIVHLVKATSEGLQRGGMFTVTEGDGKHWAHPAIANGVLYIRHGDALLAWNLRPSP